MKLESIRDEDNKKKKFTGWDDIEETPIKDISPREDQVEDNKMPILLVGCKCDLRGHGNEKIYVTKEEKKKFKKKDRLKYKKN